MKLRRSQLILIILFLNIELCFSQFNSDYIKIPFGIQNNSILIPVNFSNKAKFDLVFDSVGNENCITKQELEKFSNNLGEDVYEMLRKRMAQTEPSLTKTEIELKINEKKNGKKSLIRMKKMWCGDFFIYDEFFFDRHSLNLSGDGVICLQSFGSIKNLLINCKENILEINAPIHNGEKIPMYKIENENMYSFYIYCEINGEKKPFVLSTSAPVSTIKTDTPIEKKETFVASVNVGGVKQEYMILKHNDESHPYNFLEFPFFKDKCVQFDFENMMLYVW